MRKIDVLGLLEVDVEGQRPYTGNVRPRETSKIWVSLTVLNCSCEVDILDSQYLSSNEIECVYGEATSMLDRALERAFSVMVNEEIATVNIIFPKKFIDESLSEDLSLSCKVHLRVIEPGKVVYKLSVEEKLALAIKYKNLGVELHKEGTGVKQVSAYLFFSRAVKWLSMIGTNDAKDKSGEITSVKLQCYNNLSLYHLHKKHYPLVIAATTNVLEVDSANVKARYRRAVANTELQNYEEAEGDVESALAIDPNNGPVKKQQEELKKRQKAVSEKYAVAMKKFFS